MRIDEPAVILGWLARLSAYQLVRAAIQVGGKRTRVGAIAVRFAAQDLCAEERRLNSVGFHADFQWARYVRHGIKLDIALP